MLQSLKKIFVPDVDKKQAHGAYLHIVAQARKPFFYREYGVPDTIDGRFDIIILHMFLVIHRLRSTPEAAEFIRSLSEVFFADMDRSLREMGVGDTGVGRRVKDMAQAFYGRLQAYEQAVEQPERLTECLRRNLYRGLDIEADSLQAMMVYTERNIRHLAQQNTENLLSGFLVFFD
jgi:cytochrome b pre-mRNA-processing protein 3